MSTAQSNDDEMAREKDSGQDESPPDQIMFFTFGMFIIDEIHHPTPSTHPAQYNLPGGAGLYALLGARLLSPKPYSKRLSWILDAGSDFPSSIHTTLSTWHTSLVTRYDPNRLTTRAWNGYGNATDPEYRAFRYLTPKRRLDVEDLREWQVGGRAWHMVCSPERCMDIVRKLVKKREEVSGTGVNREGTGREMGMVVVWEPIPDLCTPEEMGRLREAARGVDIVSPNQEELRAFFEGGEEGEAMAQEVMVRRLMGWDVGCFTALDHEICNGVDDNKNEDASLMPDTHHHRAACIIREGKHGSTIYFPLPSTQSSGTQKRVYSIHLPAYHTETTAHQVTDPTGGGNTYLGALAIALAYTRKNTSTTTSTAEAMSASSEASVLPSSSSVRKITTAAASKAEPEPALTLKKTSIAAPIQTVITTLTHALTSNQSLPSHTSVAIPEYPFSLIAAGICAVVTAGFAIEQTGVPDVVYHKQNTGQSSNSETSKTKTKGESEDEFELWGGSSVRERIETYLAREMDGILRQICEQMKC